MMQSECSCFKKFERDTEKNVRSCKMVLCPQVLIEV